ncbi:Avr3b-L2 [Phytophthora nicotianae]|uniref:Avr3b-L2 n=1 Tax=Phytophthora nicotianae TaxID=4792 RepID=A0A0W8DNK1_PHYNI|nr:Avr3b-L2 [Phytophthora nicotianae]
MAALQDLELDDKEYVEFLRKLISVSEKVQNAPGLGLIPQENLVSDFVLEELKPFTGTELSVERVEFVAGRGNVIIKYAPTSAAKDKTLAFVGSHMDVVPANPEGWERDPFTLTVEGDKLYGRGTTDCLGHVALMTCSLLVLFRELAKHKVQTKTQVVCVLIASEENSEIEGVGVETLMESGKIDFLKNGPVFWVDCSDSQPCIGTAGAITWTLKATGKLFHSGLPNLGINGLELAMDAMAKIQEHFYKEFGPVDKEKDPPWAKVAGDMIAKMTAFVDDLNANITSLEGNRGPVSKYTLPDENRKGKLELVFDKSYYEGIACSLDSTGYNLPLVRDMQRGGFDLTLVGFGKSSVYHGDNEYCQLSDMKDAMKILALTIANVDAAEK